MKVAAILILRGMTSLAWAADAYVIRHARVVTVSGPVIEGGSVVIQDGRIAAVGKSVPAPRGARILDARGLSVYPGFLDADTRVGLTEIGSVSATNDTNELGDYNPHLLAYTAVHPASEHIPVARVNGITTVLARPLGGVMAGQATLINLDGWTVHEMAVRKTAGLVLNFPSILGGRQLDPATSTSRQIKYSEAKRNYEKGIRELRSLLEDGRRYLHAQQARAKDPGLPALEANEKLEALIPFLRGEEPVLVSVSRKVDIQNALEFAETEKLKIILLGAGEASKVADLLREKNVPVICGPVQSLPPQEDDPYDIAMATPALLAKAGVRFAISSNGAANVRNLPYEAGTAAAYGLPKEEALKAITLYPAQILGVADRLGSIEAGKIANLVVTDGDPLEIRTNVKHVFVAGKPVSLETKHTRLYQTYLNRP